jgi:hypothetical protein
LASHSSQGQVDDAERGDDRLPVDLDDEAAVTPSAVQVLA